MSTVRYFNINAGLNFVVYFMQNPDQSLLFSRPPAVVVLLTKRIVSSV